MLSPKQAAAHLGISVDRVRKLIRDGALRATNIGIDRPVWAIAEDELARFAALDRPAHRPRKDTTMIGSRVFHADGVTVGFIEDERPNDREYQVDWQCGTPREWCRLYLAALEPRPAIVHTTDSGKQLTPID